MIQNDFFKSLFQFCEGKIEIRPLPGEPAFFNINGFGSIDSHCQRFDKSNLCFGVATRNGQGGGKANIVNFPSVWADVDFKDTPREIAVQKLKDFPFKPSIIVKSGGGVHLYWLLKEPAEKSDISAIEDVNHRIATALGGDHNSCDAARVLRVPGTKNRKYKPARPCEVTQRNDFYYNLDDFLEILPESSHKHKEGPSSVNAKDPEWLTTAMEGVDTNKTSRNATGTKIAGYFINKLLANDVLTILKTWNINNKPPLDENELQTIVKSVSRYSPDILTKSRVDMANVYDSARMIEEYKAYIKTLKKNRFITGIKQIDKRIRGVAGGEVLTIIARSGSFKTAMLQNLLKNYISNSAWGSAFFSIEMPVASLTERYLEILDGCTGKEVENLFSDPNQDVIQQAAENSFKHELDKLFVMPTRVSLSDISAYVQLIERERNIKVGVVGIDYLGLMEGPGVSEYETISRLSTGLKSIAKLLNIPIVVLSQVSRKGASGNTEISLDMGRGSGAIEEAADFVLGLWQSGDQDEKELICKILKNRKGPINSMWKLDLIPHTLQIGPDAEPYKPAERSRGGF
jgi:archaellum biogenesis ATPase FlaH